MAESQATTQPVAPSDEVLVTQWDEPALKVVGLASNIGIIIGGAVGVALVFALLAYFLHSGTLYMATLGALAIGFLLATQVRRPSPPRIIYLTDQRLVAGKRSYALSELAGFWLSTDEGKLLVNVESNKPSPFPITLVHPSSNEESLRQELIQVLAEVEPRVKDANDTLSRYFKL